SSDQIHTHPRSTPFPYTTLFRSRTEPQAQAGQDTGRSGGAEAGQARGGAEAGGGSSAAQAAQAAQVAQSAQATQHLSTHLAGARSEEHTSELQSRENLVCRLLLE